LQINLDDIMGLSEVCEMTGKSKNYMKEYLRRGQFPQPVKELACGPWASGASSSMDGHAPASRQKEERRERIKNALHRFSGRGLFV
jgi:hypothetical protein